MTTYTLEENVWWRGQLLDAWMELDIPFEPGTPEWVAYVSAEAALLAFDRAHPEVHEELDRRLAAEKREYEEEAAACVWESYFDDGKRLCWRTTRYTTPTASPGRGAGAK